jgi:hypothetical protein
VRLTIVSILAFVMITITTGGCCSCRGKRPKKDDDESTASIPVRPTK